MLQLKRGGHRQAQGQIENYYRRAGTRKASSDFTALVNSDVAARLPPRPLVALPRCWGTATNSAFARSFFGRSPEEISSQQAI
jgi:hypothetical protein